MALDGAVVAIGTVGSQTTIVQGAWFCLESYPQHARGTIALRIDTAREYGDWISVARVPIYMMHGPSQKVASSPQSANAL